MRYAAAIRTTRARASPIAWLIGIARRCLSDHLQSRWAVVADPPEAAAPADLEERSLTRITLAEAIATLDEREQDLIALRYGADLTARQIAEALGLRTNAVEVALHRALARLRAELNREAGAVSRRIEPRSGHRPVRFRAVPRV